MIARKDQILDVHEIDDLGQFNDSFDEDLNRQTNAIQNKGLDQQRSVITDTKVQSLNVTLKTICGKDSYCRSEFQIFCRIPLLDQAFQ